MHPYTVPARAAPATVTTDTATNEPRETVKAKNFNGTGTNVIATDDPTGAAIT